MSSNKETEHATEKQTIGDFIDSHKESVILIIGLIVLLVGVLKLGHMLLNVCNEVRSTPVVRKILCFCSKTGTFQTKAKEAVSNEDDHACIKLNYDVLLSKSRTVYTEQRDNSDRLGRDISVTIKESEAGRRSILLPPTWTSCLNGTVQNGNSCYMVSKELANWPDSLVYCEAYGGNLAVIETASEQQFITAHIAKVNPTSTDSGHYYWIGGMDALKNGEWFWSKTAKPISYIHWNPGEPDSSGGHTSKTQDCLALYSNGLWDDGWCKTQHNFLCEFKLNEDNVLVG